MKQNINQDIAMAIFNSTDRPSQSRNIVSLREKVEAYANQRVIEELEEVLKSNMDIKETPFISAINIANLKLANRIKELKQD